MSEDKRKGPWSAARRAAHGARIRAALAGRGPKKTSKVKKSRGRVRSGGTLTDLMNTYDRARQAAADAKQALIDHLSE